ASQRCTGLNLIHYTFAIHGAAHIVRSKPGNAEAVKPANLNIKTQALIRFDVAGVNYLVHKPPCSYRMIQAT
ncbi:hypothetical protein, partial [Eikenella corrodens]|uniref:hypothetical protein n=1 Tax=Eikenella corrodens TaxID=539 RepID=UPI001955E63D